MSLINPNDIDGNFPVFGQDNPTQGFRDNFTNIKNNLNFARQEIDDLQSKAVLKSALSGTSLTNDMQGAVLENPQLKAFTVSYYDLGEQTGNVAVDFEVGNFQKITTTGDINLSLINWPATSGSGVVGYASLRLWFVIGQAFNETFNTLVPHSVTLPGTVNIGINDITGYVADTNTITFDVPGNYIFDISSADGGLTYLIFDNTRNRVRFRDSYFYFNPDVTGDNNVLLLGYGPALPLALAVEREGRDTVSARGSFASYESVLYHGNDVGLGDGISGNLNFAGYSVASSRSFIAANNVLINQGLGSKDQIGYYSAVGAVGNPSNIGNLTTATFGTIEFATNSELPTYITSLFIPPYGSIDNYSPGGNITFRTKQDYGLFGLTSWPRSDSPLPPGSVTAPGGLLAKALSLENDQSVRFYGATTRAYQVINLDTDLDGLGTANVSPYVSEVILDSNTSPFLGAAIILPPRFALKDGQELNISSNVAIGALTITPAVGNVTIPVQKQTAFAVGNGTSVTIFFDNSGNLFSTGGAVSITDFIPSAINSAAPFFANVITGFSASSITILSSGLIGNVTRPGNVTTTTNFIANTSVTGAPVMATVAAGANYKWIYNDTKKHWHKIG